MSQLSSEYQQNLIDSTASLLKNNKLPDLLLFSSTEKLSVQQFDLPSLCHTPEQNEPIFNRFTY